MPHEEFPTAIRLTQDYFVYTKKSMLILWDEHKRLANLAKHGLDFAELEDGFDFANAVDVPVRPSKTGRARKALIGELNGALIVVVIASPLGSEAISIVSLRPASIKERKTHGF